MLRQHGVKIGKKIQNKLVKIKDELGALDIDIEFQERRSKLKAAAGIAQAFAYASDIWLLYSVGKEAIGNWPSIRKLLVSAGLTRGEIITLGLSKMTKPSPKRSSTKKKSKKL
jgi:hypothetical protein